MPFAADKSSNMFLTGGVINFSEIGADIFEKLKKGIDIFLKYAIIQKLSDSEEKFGGIAQLGERLNGIQEVSGSIPLISTITKRV